MKLEVNLLEMEEYIHKVYKKYIEKIMSKQEFSRFSINHMYYFHFERIDTISEIFLNGKPIGRTANAHISHRLSIPSSLLKQGKNLLSIFLSPAMAFVNKNADLPEMVITNMTILCKAKGET